MTDIGGLVYAALSSSPALAALVSTRYGQALPQGTALPYVTWRTPSMAPVDQGGAVFTVTLECECVAAAHATADSVADAVAAAIGFTTPIHGTGITAVGGVVTERRTVAEPLTGENDIGRSICTVSAVWWCVPS